MNSSELSFEILSSFYLTCPWINNEAEKGKRRSPGTRQMSSDVIAIRVIGNVEGNQSEIDDQDARGSYVNSKRTITALFELLLLQKDYAIIPQILQTSDSRYNQLERD
jgi:hypothetical protein